jgi:hypothetical protein
MNKKEHCDETFYKFSSKSKISELKQIYLLMREKEIKQSVKYNYIVDCKEITPRTRSMNVEWLIDVNIAMKYKQETLYLATYIMDKFFSMETNIAQSKLQLVTITSLFIASKFEEIEKISKEDCSIYSGHAYTGPDVLKMEMIILEKLEFNIKIDSIHSFLDLFLELDGFDNKKKLLAELICELCLLDEEYLCYRLSFLSISGIVVVNRLLESEYGMSKELSSFSEFCEKDTMTSVIWIHFILAKFDSFLKGDDTPFKAESVKKIFINQRNKCSEYFTDTH